MFIMKITKFVPICKFMLTALCLSAALFCGSLTAQAEPRLNLKEIQRLAEQGSAVYQFELAKIYANGDGVAQDFKTAETWLIKAAAHDYAEAQSMLGLFYYFGVTGRQDYGKALDWLAKAAKQNNPVAQFNLGMMNLNGEGLEPNSGMAFRYIKASAEQGYAQAQFNLAVLYETGVGIEANLAQALTWYRKAAEQDIVAAQVNLAFMYAEGRGTVRNEAKAIAWFHKAAESYNAVAMLKMAEAYFNGTVIKPDYVRAYILVNLALQKAEVKANPQVAAAAQVLKENIVGKLNGDDLTQAEAVISKETVRNQAAAGATGP